MTELGYLADRVRQGDPEAMREWQRTMQPRLMTIVRRTIQVGTAQEGFARRVLAVVHRYRQMNWPVGRDRSEQLVYEVASQLCQSTLQNLQHDPSASQCMKDTVREY